MILWLYVCLLCTFTFTFRAFSRRFHPKRLTISTFVIRSAMIHRYRYGKDVHRTKCSTDKRQSTMSDEPKKNVHLGGH